MAGEQALLHHDRLREIAQQREDLTTKTLDRLCGGAEHCQTGNLSLVHATIFDWATATFGCN
jgi:hypothetical protein